MSSTSWTASMASMNITASFHQKHYWSWWLDHPWHPNDQYWSLYVEGFIKNPMFHWYVLFLSEAVETNFFENWLIKLKCPNLLKPLGTIFKKNHQSFYPLEPFSYVHFTMIHPVFDHFFDARAEIRVLIGILGELKKNEELKTTQFLLKFPDL